MTEKERDHEFEGVKGWGTEKALEFGGRKGKRKNVVIKIQPRPGSGGAFL